MVGQPEELPEDVVGSGGRQLLDLALLGRFGLRLLMAPEARGQRGQARVVRGFVELVAGVARDPRIGPTVARAETVIQLRSPALLKAKDLAHLILKQETPL